MNDRRAFIGLAGAGAVGLLLFGRSGSWAAPAGHFAVTRSPADWQHMLGPKRYAVLRQAATEPPFSSRSRFWAAYSAAAQASEKRVV